MNIYMIEFVATSPGARNRNKGVLLDGNGYFTSQKHAQAVADRYTAERREKFNHGYYRVRRMERGESL